MLSPLKIPGLFITGTDTGVGKTIVAASIAYALRQRGKRVAVCKPIATGCLHRREGLVSEDAEMLALHADTLFPLDLICPQRYAEPLAPSVAAERAKEPVEWSAVDRAIQIMSRDCDVIVIEGVGGVLVPLDDRHTVLDLAQWLDLPTVVVARAGLGTINHTLLTLHALRSKNIKIAGVVINRYPAEVPDLASETNPRIIEKRGKTAILALIPETKLPSEPTLPDDILTAISRVDWEKFC